MNADRMMARCLNLPETLYSCGSAAFLCNARNRPEINSPLIMRPSSKIRAHMLAWVGLNTSMHAPYLKTGKQMANHFFIRTPLFVITHLTSTEPAVGFEPRPTDYESMGAFDLPKMCFALSASSSTNTCAISPSLLRQKTPIGMLGKPLSGSTRSFVSCSNSGVCTASPAPSPFRT